MGFLSFTLDLEQLLIHSIHRSVGLLLVSCEDFMNNIASGNQSQSSDSLPVRSAFEKIPLKDAGPQRTISNERYEKLHSRNQAMQSMLYGLFKCQHESFLIFSFD